MAVKIKLKRLGRTRVPHYRIVVADARTKRDGRAIEEIGTYHPKDEPSLIQVNSERAQHWLSVGAQPTDAVRVILKVTGDWQKFAGESGAEGTLRTAETRGDKQETFAAALAQAHANKPADGVVAASRPQRKKADQARADSEAAADAGAEPVAAAADAAADSPVAAAADAADSSAEATEGSGTSEPTGEPDDGAAGGGEPVNGESANG